MSGYSGSSILELIALSVRIRNLLLVHINCGIRRESCEPNMMECVVLTISFKCAARNCRSSVYLRQFVGQVLRLQPSDKCFH